MCFSLLNKLRPTVTGLATSMFAQKGHSQEAFHMQHSAKIMNAFTQHIVAKAERYQSCPKRVKHNNERSYSNTEFMICNQNKMQL